MFKQCLVLIKNGAQTGTKHTHTHEYSSHCRPHLHGSLCPSSLTGNFSLKTLIRHRKVFFCLRSCSPRLLPESRQRSSPRSLVWDVTLMYSCTARTHWARKSDDTDQSVLFSRGPGGDIFQRGIHHAVTTKKLKRNTKCLFVASKWVSKWRIRVFSFGEALLINTDFGYGEAWKQKMEWYPPLSDPRTHTQKKGAMVNMLCNTVHFSISVHHIESETCCYWLLDKGNTKIVLYLWFLFLCSVGLRNVRA